jgi:hypothetical protein
MKPKKMKVEWQFPGLPWNVHIFEEGKEKSFIRSLILIVDCESNEVFYIENLPPDWVRSLIKDSKIKIYNPSERR